MRKRTPKIISVILLVMLCLSLLPAMAMAADSEASVPESGQTSDATASSDASSSTPEAASGPVSSEPEPPAESIPVPTAEPAPESTPEPASESLPEPTAEPDPAPPLAGIRPELFKVAAQPLIRVEYHYYDDTKPSTATDFDGYTVLSTHSFCARAFATEDDTAITIAANRFPGLVPVSTDAARFCVVLDGATDITALASYDAATGTVTLPYECTGHAITISFYCPASEVVELPVTVSTSFYQSGVFTDTTTGLALASSANTVSIPLAVASAVVIEQNGMPLDGSAYNLTDGTLTILAPALGGDISIAAYAPRPRTRAGGQVAHTMDPNKIYYGTFFTTYFTANGNTAFCLNPLLYGPASTTSAATSSRAPMICSSSAPTTSTAGRATIR